MISSRAQEKSSQSRAIYSLALRDDNAQCMAQRRITRTLKNVVCLITNERQG